MENHEPTTYCLYCYAPIAHGGKAVCHCPACDHLDIRADHAIYWTREPSLEKAERLLKLIVIGALLLACAVVIPEFLEMKASGPGAGWVIVVPLVALGMLLWQTVSLVTHKPRYARVRLTWTLIFLLLPIAPILFAFAVSVSVEEFGFEWLGGAALMAAVVLPPSLAFGLVAWKSGTWFECFKRRRIDGGRVVA